MAERFHRMLKAELSMDRSHHARTDNLPSILLSIRCTIKEDLAELVFGITLILSIQYFEDHTANFDLFQKLKNNLRLP